MSAVRRNCGDFVLVSGVSNQFLTNHKEAPVKLTQSVASFLLVVP